MKLTEDQLYIQQRADKTLSFGCIVKPIHSAIDIPPLRMIYVNYDYDVDGAETNYSTIILERTVGIHNENVWLKTDTQIIGHPMTYSRLVYLSTKTLREIYQDKDFNTRFLKYEKLYNNLQRYFVHNIEELNGNILTWSNETIKVVKDFLDSLPKE